MKLENDDDNNDDGRTKECVNDEQIDENMKSEAAIKIQSCYRGYAVRKQYKKPDETSKFDINEEGID